MKNELARMLLFLALASPVAAQQSPYVALQDRPLKALSDEQIRGYREGAGMGLALVAELNGYPGPKHLLELAGQLALTPEQKRSVQGSFDRMQSEAARLGAEIVAAEASLDDAFREATIDAKRLEELTLSIGALQGRLRKVHLDAHLESRALLTSDQLASYSRLRGYGSRKETAGHAHGHRHEP
jgi:hypothetical protein